MTRRSVVNSIAATVGYVALLFGPACSDETAEIKLTRDQLLDPKACKDCHPNHYREWAGSMHAYAADDPVFLAMNARGQRETKGELGDFCVKCHAPMAVRLGATTDGLNLATVPPHLKGVTCFFCHSADEVTGDHNAAVELSDDGAMRGGLSSPLATDAHAMLYSTLHDGVQLDSSKLCGACHDIVTDKGVHIERTFKEWRGTLFSKPTFGQQAPCSSCHMHTDFGKAADVAGAKIRRLHRHGFPGVDVAITEFPDQAKQREHIQTDLDPTVLAQLCVEMTETTETRVEVYLQNVAAGHSFPSGASADRRLWVELIASKGGKIVHSSGAVKDGEAVANNKDPDLWLLRDTLRDGKFKEVHMFWEAEKIDSQLLPGPPADTSAGASAAETRRVRTYVMKTKPDTIRMRLRLRPIGLEILKSLVSSKDLDGKHIASMPTFDLAGADLTWTVKGAKEKTTPTGRKAMCVPRLLVKGADDPLAGADTYKAGMVLTSKKGQLRIALEKATPAPPAQGKNSWVVAVTDAQGVPLDDLTIDGGTWMPDHHHGSPILASSTSLGGGRYLVAPVELFMPGLWEITLGITGKSSDDKVVFRFWVAE